MMPWCICVLRGVCTRGPMVSVALRPVFSDALVHLCGTACALGLEGQSGSNASDARVHLCMACHVQCGSEASEL